MEARYFKIRNWDKFQHYKQRNPPWIRLHRTLLRDHKFNQLSEWEQWTLVRLWLLASEASNHMAFDERWVRKAINATKRVPLEKYVNMGFIELVSERDASSVLAPRKQSAEPEAEVSEAEVSEQSSGASDFVLRLLKVMHDADERTPIVLRTLIETNRLTEGDVAWAIECATGPGVQSPTRVGVAELKKRAESRRAAA